MQKQTGVQKSAITVVSIIICTHNKILTKLIKQFARNDFKPNKKNSRPTNKGHTPKI